MWQPPYDPDPSDILQEAVDDSRDGRSELALTKFLWFHGNALHYEPSLLGVRLSFALSYWLDFASEYKPAMDAYLRVRRNRG
ncbi:MAG: hypothetical protein U0992_10475 [Planctomycetaceae bacterium]